MEHHDAAIERFVTRVSSDHTNVAVIVVGSVAHRQERSDSDVDVYLVVTETEFKRAHDGQQLSYATSDDTDYEGGYVDVKVASVEYLRHAALAGDEPTRASFVCARVVWSRDPQVEQLVRRIPRLEDFVFEERARSFIAQARLQAHYFLKQAHSRGNTFLLHHAATHLVLACGRALLAHNRRLYQGPKYLEHLIEALPDKPANMTALMRNVLSSPDPTTAQTLLASVEHFRDWNLGYEETLSVFVEDNELGWLTGAPPPHVR